MPVHSLVIVVVFDVTSELSRYRIGTAEAGDAIELLVGEELVAFRAWMVAVVMMVVVMGLSCCANAREQQY